MHSLPLRTHISNIKNSIGTGIRITDKKPNKLIAQATPRFSNMAPTNNGNLAVAKTRTNVLAAIALFA